MSRTTCIRLSETEERYAKALSKRVAGCRRPKVGSVAHGLKWALREQAKREGLKIFEE
jgi:hypothetical protein